MLKKTTIKNNSNFHQSETKLVIWLIAFSFFLGIAIAFYFTMSISLFLDRVDFRLIDLSWVYVGSGILSLLLSKLVQYFQQKIQSKYIAVIGLVFLMITTSLLLSGQSMWPVSIASFTLFIWVSALMYFKSFCFWGLVNSILDLDQGKRLFGIIGIGEVLSNALSFFSIPFLLTFTWIDINDLGIVAMAALFMAILAAVCITKYYVESNVGENASKQEVQQNKTMLQTDYRLLIMLCVTSSILCFYFVDFLFLEVSHKEFQGNEIASFMAYFWGTVAVLELLSKTFLYTPLLKYFGIKFTLILLPIAIISITLFLIFGVLSDTISSLLLIIFLKLIERVLNNSVSLPSMQIIYQTFPDRDRQLIQAKIEGLSNGYGNLLAGSLLLCITFFQLGTFYNFLLITLISGVWIYIVIKLYHRYKSILKEIVSIKNPSPSLVKSLTNRHVVLEYLKNHSNKTARKIIPLVDEANEIIISNDFTNPVNNLVKLEDNFNHAKTTNQKVLVIKHYESCQSVESAIKLTEKLKIEQKQIKVAVIETLNKINIEPHEKVKQHIKEEIHQLMAIILWFEASLIDLQVDRAQIKNELLLQLNKEKEDYMGMLFDLLSLLFGKSLFEKVRANLKSHDHYKTNAFTLELINNFVNDEIKTLLIPLFSNTTNVAKVKLLKSYFPQQQLSTQDRLIDILNFNYGLVCLWLKSLALHEILKLNSEKGNGVILACLHHYHPLLREMATNAISNKNRDFSELFSDNTEVGSKEYTFDEKLRQIKSTLLFNDIDNAALIELLEKTAVITINENTKYYIFDSKHSRKLHFILSEPLTFMVNGKKQKRLELGNLLCFNDSIAPSHPYLIAKKKTRIVVFNTNDLINLMSKEISNLNKLIKAFDWVA